MLADKPDNPECWGVVTSQRATNVGDIGDHASNQDTPRLGLANVARLFEYHVSELGSFLAEVDRIDYIVPIGVYSLVPGTENQLLRYLVPEGHIMALRGDHPPACT